ncbi:hypothetical protein AU467_25925 [Mesorhizobium loti]|uniref:Uncharacterized protein n=1 Tax=Rhizobium loti TaxID=381 RepID=A0A101KRI2_RHILI|nr:hypothetical protein AU467_25925 [Mesorhizobium loti]
MPDEVIGNWNCLHYIARQMKVVRCILAAVLLLVLGGGMALSAGKGDDMAAPGVQVSAGASVPGNCNNCKGGDMAIGAACSVLQTCMPGVSPLDGSPIMPVMASAVHSYDTGFLNGLRRSPEPLPPKSDILA